MLVARCGQHAPPAGVPVPDWSACGYAELEYPSLSACGIDGVAWRGLAIQDLRSLINGNVTSEVAPTRTNLVGSGWPGKWHDEHVDG